MKKIFQTLLNLKYSNEVVKFYFKNLRKNTFFLEKDNKLVINKKFFQQPYENDFQISFRSLRLIGENIILLGEKN